MLFEGTHRVPWNRRQIIDGKMICGRCRMPKYLEEFGKSKAELGGRRTTCRKCLNSYSRDRRPFYGSRKTGLRYWRAMNPESARASNRRSRFKRYGLTPEQYDAIVDRQDGRCAICGVLVEDALHVDHFVRSDGSGVVRGLLCFQCNIGIGNLGHDIERLLRAIEYLKPWENA